MLCLVYLSLPVAEPSLPSIVGQHLIESVVVGTGNRALGRDGARPWPKLRLTPRIPRQLASWPGTGDTQPCQGHRHSLIMADRLGHFGQPCHPPRNGVLPTHAQWVRQLPGQHCSAVLVGTISCCYSKSFIAFQDINSEIPSVVRTSISDLKRLPIPQLGAASSCPRTASFVLQQDAPRPLGSHADMIPMPPWAGLRYSGEAHPVHQPFYREALGMLVCMHTFYNWSPSPRGMGSLL
ncbi:hypothetical protein F5883DRAFT_45710 [Diaporthe sp. PMI_573]|nr:hypothetical protein F5883DRAFT_45710 [Diaporthaceae sp. PMI_573]